MCVSNSQLGAGESGTDSVLQQNADGTRTWVPSSGVGSSAINQLTGDVTAGPGSGSVAATIANDAVTYAKLQNISAASRLLGRGSAAGSGDTQELTVGNSVTIAATVVDTVQDIRTTATPQFARLGLGAAADASAVGKFVGQYFSPLVADGNSGTTKTIDWNAGNEHFCTLTGNVTFTFSNPVDGGRYVLLLATGAGSFTATWPASVLWPGGTAPTITVTASKLDLITFIYVSGTSKYYGSFNQAY